MVKLLRNLKRQKSENLVRVNGELEGKKKEREDEWDEQGGMENGR